MAPKSKSIPLAHYIAERTGVLSEEQIANYIEELSTNEAVLKVLKISADRTISMSLSPRDNIDNALIQSSHALNFLRRNGLPDKGIQDLQQAQYRFATAKLVESNRDQLDWFQRLVRRIC